MSDFLKNDENKALFGLFGNDEKSKEAAISEKRRKAGKKGGNAPHRCRGRGCNKTEDSAE